MYRATRGVAPTVEREQATSVKSESVISESDVGARYDLARAHAMRPYDRFGNAAQRCCAPTVGAWHCHAL